LGPEKALRNQNVNTSRLLKFPEDVGTEVDGLQHFMLITEYEFKNNIRRNKDPLTDFSDFFESNDFIESKNAFAFYLPKGALKTQYSASHGAVDFGFFGALLNSESSDILTRLQSQLPEIVGGDENIFSRSAGFYGTIGSTLYDELSPSIQNYDFKTKFGFNIGEAIGGLVMEKDKSSAVASLSMRKSGNPFTTLVFQGIKERRQHVFAFDFYPRNIDESNKILNIITRLKRGMLPSLKKSGKKETRQITMKKQVAVEANPADRQAGYYNTGLYTSKTIKKTVDVNSTSGKVLSSAFFDYPSVYKIGFYKKNGDKNEYLHQIGQSSILNLKVTYGEGNQQVFFKDSGAPQHIKLDITFKENFGLTRNFAKQLEGV